MEKNHGEHEEESLNALIDKLNAFHSITKFTTGYSKEGSSIKDIRKNFQKTNISNPLMQTYSRK